jgi:hypothetical protein
MSTELLKGAYPSQEDPQYWEKVPYLFELEFADKEKLKTFKNNWFVHQVPLYLISYDSVVHSYMTESLKMIIENYDDNQHRSLIDLCTEPKRGHTQKSYQQTTKTFNITHRVKGKDYLYHVKDAGFLRSIRLHNVLQFELNTGKHFKNYDIIVELGGGIGEFAKIAREVGFQGQYYNIDFTPMCEINMYNNEYDPRNSYVNMVSQLPKFPHDAKILFIGTWSFSELPVLYREEIVSTLPSTCDWLLTVQSTVMNVNNNRYFDQTFTPRLQNKRVQKIDIPWHPFQGGNYYYFAT